MRMQGPAGGRCGQLVAFPPARRVLAARRLRALPLDSLADDGARGQSGLSRSVACARAGRARRRPGARVLHEL